MKMNTDKLKARLGERRTITKFALIPIQIEEEVRWLEKVTLIQEVRPVDVGGSMQWGKFKHYWCDLEFVK